MFSFYLYNKSYEKANVALIEANLQLLNDLVIAERKEEDFFYKNDSIWDVETEDGNFTDVILSKLSDKQLSQTVIPRLFQAITSISENFLSLEEIDRAELQLYNAFYGIVFDVPLPERYINSKETYFLFRNNYLWKITPKLLWERKEKLFSRTILCPDVENNLKDIGAKYFPQIVSRLMALDKYAAKEWVAGEFDCQRVNSLTPLRISSESKETMRQKKYYNLRLFKMPDGSTQCFELHIKTGELRFHFYPENGKIFVGYIGKHLPTVKY